MIRRGTAPEHTITLPCDSSRIKSLIITYAQNGIEVFHKTKEDCEFNGNTGHVTLTQEDTLSLKPKLKVQAQMRALTTDGVPLVSPIEADDVGDVLNDEVMI